MKIPPAVHLRKKPAGTAEPDLKWQARRLHIVFCRLHRAALNNSGSNTGNGDNSGSISDGLSGIGFTQRYSNVYVCEENDTYYGEIITQPNVTIIYIKQRSGTFDSRIQTVLARLLPDEYGQVWSNYLSANTDRTFTAEGRRVRIVVAPNGGHSQIVIYN